MSMVIQLDSGQILISPTEPTELKAIGEVSSEPEKYGCDVLFQVEELVVGVQRKETRDLVNSLRDGRFPTLLGKMTKLDLGMFIIEGDWQWNNDGSSLKVNGFTVDKLNGLLFSIQSRGYWVLQVPTLKATCESVLRLKSRLEKPEHQSSLLVRPKPSGQWGRLNSADWAIYLLQSFEGIGITQAGRIYRHFDGKVPIKWDCSLEDLIAVEGIGAKRAMNLWQALNMLMDSDETEELLILDQVERR